MPLGFFNGNFINTLTVCVGGSKAKLMQLPMIENITFCRSKTNSQSMIKVYLLIKQSILKVQSQKSTETGSQKCEKGVDEKVEREN